MSNSTAPQKNATKNWTSRLLFGGVVLICIAGLVSFFILNFGWVQGEQLNPVTFEHRRFQYVRLPPSNIHLYPVSYEPDNSPIHDFLKKNKVLSKIEQPKNSIWHESHSTSGGASQTGDAKILVDYLAESDEDGKKLFWIDWSEKNPEMADVFWPLVSKVAQAEAYLIVPELFPFVRTLKDKQTFETKLKKMTADLTGSLGSDFHAVQEFDKAIPLYSLAIDLDAENDEYIQKRSECYEASETDQ